MIELFVITTVLWIGFRLLRGGNGDSTDSPPPNSGSQSHYREDDQELKRRLRQLRDVQAERDAIEQRVHVTRVYDAIAAERRNHNQD